ncbi:hypothetical protein [Chromobacterium phragmitis]|uniref:Uncharacterized protein n=1 Tax=Chromobacterium phragmitis TaxID=2202141 RepID=A0A344UIL8_9NEIS|nr:hypothetical protein [Chromobacterium phragmitis]AXE35116.1 hypothetical protein DK843_12950 [Chromobacterium phragmitis]
MFPSSSANSQNCTPLCKPRRALSACSASPAASKSNMIAGWPAHSRPARYRPGIASSDQGCSRRASIMQNAL